MALAPFFDKAALSAAGILKGFERIEFARNLEAHCIGIHIASSSLQSFEGTTAVEMAVNLIARLYPRFSVWSTAETDSVRIERLVRLARSINPGIEVEHPTAATLTLVIGESEQRHKSAYYIGSDGWIAKCSASRPLNSGDTDNPFGAAAAACIGAANIFRIVFAAQLARPDLDEELSLSLHGLTPPLGNALPNPPLGDVVLEETHLVGAGAVGNAFLWCLARTPRLEGKLHVIDFQKLDGSNVQRYALAGWNDVSSAKVDIAKTAFDSTQPAERSARSTQIVEAHQCTWAQYLAGRPRPWRLARVVIALDSAEDRCDVQAAIPRFVLNGWTQPGDLGISLHDFLHSACLACLYTPTSASKNEDELIAEAVGLTEQLLTVRKLLFTGEPLGSELLKQISNSLAVPLEELLPYAQRPLRDFYSEAVCGGIVLRLQKGQHSGGGTEVPLAFQSAFAGVVLAAFTVLHTQRPEVLVPGWKYVVDLLRPLARDFRIPVAKHPAGRCICQDPDYIDLYCEQYGAA